MVTKGIVEKIIDVYQAKVRIPVFDGAANVKQSTSSSDLSIASVCIPISISRPVQVGDIVYVAFEDNDRGSPVIIGHLYRENASIETDLTVDSLKSNQLNVINYASLPAATTIGNIKQTEISSLSGIKGNIQEQLDTITDHLNILINSIIT